MESIGSGLLTEGFMALMPVLDAHHHLWDLSVRRQPWLDTDPVLTPLRRDFGLEDLAPLAAAAGVTGTVIVQTVTEPGETPEMLALTGRGSLINAVVGWADLTAPGVADDLAALRDRPDGRRLAGIRHPVLMETDPDWLMRPDVLRGLAAVGAAGLTYDVVVQPAQLPAAAAAAARLGDLVFVLDHLGNVEVEPEIDERWATAFRRFAALPNTVGKLSGIFAEPPPAGSAEPGPDGPDVGHLRPYYEIALECFGPERLMFGSDWPVSSLAVAYGDVVAAARKLTRELSLPEQQAIFGQTARRVYRIGDGDK
jgi:L-fuconolactonase